MQSMAWKTYFALICAIFVGKGQGQKMLAYPTCLFLDCFLTVLIAGEWSHLWSFTMSWQESGLSGCIVCELIDCILCFRLRPASLKRKMCLFISTALGLQ